jgi:hypothetical protein
MMVLEINTSQGRGCGGDADRCRFVEMRSLRSLGSISRDDDPSDIAEFGAE